MKEESEFEIKGGNWVGAKATATHKPTGRSVSCADFMSPYQNAEAALERLKRELAENSKK